MDLDAVRTFAAADLSITQQAVSKRVAALEKDLGEQTRLARIDDHGLRRVAVHGPAPVSPHSLIWRADNAHPALAALRDHLGDAGPGTGTWTPGWT